MMAGVGGPGCWRCGVRRAFIVVSVEYWWMRSGCSMWSSCWVVRLAGAVGGLVVGFFVQFVCRWVLWYAQSWAVVDYLQYV